MVTAPWQWADMSTLKEQGTWLLLYCYAQVPLLPFPWFATCSNQLCSPHIYTITDPSSLRRDAHLILFPACFSAPLSHTWCTPILNRTPELVRIAAASNEQQAGKEGCSGQDPCTGSHNPNPHVGVMLTWPQSSRRAAGKHEHLKGSPAQPPAIVTIGALGKHLPPCFLFLSGEERGKSGIIVRNTGCGGDPKMRNVT